MSSELLTVGQYLAKRLQEIGAKNIFGVVGDYVLGLMDVLLANNLKLIATCNELNAGYAADGVRNLMAQLHESRQEEDNPEPPAWLSSHPNTKQRMSYVEQLVVDNNLDRYAYEGVARHQGIKEIVTAQWDEYEECAEDVTTIKEAKKCAGEDESENLEKSEPDREDVPQEKTEESDPEDLTQEKTEESESEATVEEDSQN